MAVRGKVKDLKDNNGVFEGTVTDTAAKVDYKYSQPCGKELGIVAGSIVRMELITLSDGSQMAVSLNPVERAKITTIDPVNNKGVLTDNLGNKIEFIQNYCNELGLNVGDSVGYAPVIVNGVWMATALQK